MNRPHDVSEQLKRLCRFRAIRPSLDENIYELTGLAATVLAAECCSFFWSGELRRVQETGAAGGADADAIINSKADCMHDVGHASPTQIGATVSSGVASGAMRARSAGVVTLVAPIESGGEVIGAIHVSGPKNKPCFDGNDLPLLDVVTLLIGKSIEVMQLHNVLKSRFIQTALARSATEATFRPIPPPSQMARILAKSFFREMSQAGFGSDQIINAASQIIDELTINLRKHSKRVRIN